MLNHCGNCWGASICEWGGNNTLMAQSVARVVKQYRCHPHPHAYL